MLVDASLAAHLARINAAGYRSVQSCSGLRKDHPGEGAGHGYIAWLRADLDVDKASAIMRAAQAAGLEESHGDIFFQPALSVHNSLLADGTRERSIRLEANAITCAEMGCTDIPSGEGFLPWLEQRNSVLERLARAHGGQAIKTDAQIARAWGTFTAALLGS